MPVIPKFGPKREVHFLDVWDIADGNFSKWRNTPTSRKKTIAKPYISSYFYHCRDQFHSAFNKNCKDILFCCGQWKSGRSKGRSVEAFIHEAERRLRVKRYTKFGPTQRLDIVWLTVSPFWMEESMRRSLFTALLRAGMHYDRRVQDFDRALTSDRYLAGTQEAVQRFLDGHTHCTTSRYGWFNVFGRGGWRWHGAPDYQYLPVEPPTTAKIQKLLVKPKG